MHETNSLNLKEIPSESTLVCVPLHILHSKLFVSHTANHYKIKSVINQHTFTSATYIL